MKQKVATSKEKLYYCNLCDHYTTRKFNMQKHVKTLQHLQNVTENAKKNDISNNTIHNSVIIEMNESQMNETEKKIKKVVSKDKPETCRYCMQVFKSRTTCWRHEKTCKHQPNTPKINEESNIESNKESNKESNAATSIIEELKKDKEQLLKTISEMAPKIGNNINIQVFLNEECKNAMNFADFIESIPLTLNDLDYTYKNGKLEGVSNVIIKELEVMGKTERPLHCNNNNTIYVKDKDKWQEDINNTKLKTTIETVENEHLKLIHEWEVSNEGWMENAKLCTEYLDLVKTVMPNLQDKEKRQIINKISKIIKI
tara:strand:+ start:895 stop:1836 length:942 start_codon:yes stop_codon:yes gene_type:complete